MCLGIYIFGLIFDVNFDWHIQKWIINSPLLMKAKYFLLFVLMFSIPVLLEADDRHPDQMVKDIGDAISKGSARDLARFFGQNVDLYLPRAEGTFSKSHSEVIMRDFFSRNAPRSYSLITKGTSGDGSVYVIGRYITRDGQRYRCYFLIKSVSQSYYLHHIQFDVQ